MTPVSAEDLKQSETLDLRVEILPSRELPYPLLYRSAILRMMFLFPRWQYVSSLEGMTYDE